MNAQQLRARFTTGKTVHHARRAARLQEKEAEQRKIFTRAEMEHLTDHYVCAYCGGPLRFKFAQVEDKSDQWHVFCPAHADDVYFISQLARTRRKNQAREEYFAVKRALQVNKIEPFYDAEAARNFDETTALAELGF